MAEGWLRYLSGGQVPVQSAGTHPSSVHPLAVQVMQEVGIDIRQQQSTHIDALHSPLPTIVITVCDQAREECHTCVTAPIQFHWSVSAPARLQGPGREPLAVFRLLRDELRERVEGLLLLLPRLASNAA
jgi:protein-tyrosine-phosphatase